MKASAGADGTRMEPAFLLNWGTTTTFIGPPSRWSSTFLGCVLHSTPLDWVKSV